MACNTSFRSFQKSFYNVFTIDRLSEQWKFKLIIFTFHSFRSVYNPDDMEARNQVRLKRNSILFFTPLGSNMIL